MNYLFDTDHFSILQRKTGSEFHRLAAWMSGFSSAEFACCVVTLHEQLLGAHAYLNKAKDTIGLIRGYRMLNELHHSFTMYLRLPFDSGSAGIYDGWVASNLRVGKMDLRLAAISQSRQLTVLTRNLNDFGRIPGVKCEDRTV